MQLWVLMIYHPGLLLYSTEAQDVSTRREEGKALAAGRDRVSADLGKETSRGAGRRQ